MDLALVCGMSLLDTLCNAAEKLDIGAFKSSRPNTERFSCIAKFPPTLLLNILTSISESETLKINNCVMVHGKRGGWPLIEVYYNRVKWDNSVNTDCERLTASLKV